MAAAERDVVVVGGGEAGILVGFGGVVEVWACVEGAGGVEDVVVEVVIVRAAEEVEGSVNWDVATEVDVVTEGAAVVAVFVRAE